jgi:hypothetical protein
MEKNINKKSKIYNIWSNMIELIAIEEQIIQKLDNFEKSLAILNKKLNNLGAS